MAKLKNPPLLLHDLFIILDNLASLDAVPVRVSHIGGKDHYVTGVLIAADKSHIRLTTSIGEIEIDGTTDEAEDASE